jgi:lipid-A-disaccharide synthase
MLVFISAGEASADAYGAALAEELSRAEPKIHLRGIGGPKMLSSGVKLIRNSADWGVISIFQVVRKLPTLWSGYRDAKRFLEKAQEKGGGSKLFVPIDFGYMNIRLARFAKQHGWKVLYLVPPGSWRRDKQGADLPTVTDAIVTPFSWSAEILNGMGANAHWYGHPIKQLLRGSRGEIRGSRIAVLPGSRAHEIEENLPLIAASINADHQLEFALAPTINPKIFQRDWQKLTGRTKDQITISDSAAVLRRARAAIVCSGTATLEAALCRCPMVVVYRLSKGMQLEVKLLRIKRPKFVALPNILLDREVVPELVQEDANAERLRAELAKILEESPSRQRQLENFEELDTVLGPARAITETASLALGYLRTHDTTELKG